jgi:hypothetical protein
VNQRDGVVVRGPRSIPGWVWVALAVVVGLIDFWGSRYNLNPDGVSYVEMAGHAVASGPGGAINGYWSPGYPALIAPVLWLVHSGWVAAIPALHVVNLAIYILSLLVFLKVMRTAASPEADVNAPALAVHVAPFAVAVFVVIAMQCIGLGLLTPDFGVMFFVLITVLACWQLERSPHSWRTAVGLGLVLGLGYWMKAILLPLNALLLLGLFALPPRAVRARTKILVAAVAFVLSALPLIVLVSAKVGHLTMGEVGRLNYAWEVDGVTPFVGWVGDSAVTFGSPVHPPRVLQPAPQTLEFATPIRATYPLWFDPSYWYAGVRSRIDLAGQWRVLKRGLHDIALLLQDEWAVMVGLIALWLASARRPGRTDRSNVPVVIALWSIAAALVYALVHVEARYLAGFVAAGVVAAWSGLSRRTPRRAIRLVLPAVLVALLVSLVRDLSQNTGGFEPAYRPDYLVEAGQLHGIGVARGDPVAMVGDAFEAYAAFGAGTPITAQVIDSIGFWQLTAAARSELNARLAATGVKALLANNVAPAMRAEGWRIFPRPDSSNLGVLVLVPR